jgi:glutathione S-transferase
VMRLGRGSYYYRSTPPSLLLELYSYEGSPFCRIVREVLCELELAYLLHNVAHGSPKREAFVQRSGKMMVPYLIDPNHNVAMFESADIVAHLRTTYAAT